MKQFLLGIDLGSTSLKAILYEQNGTTAVKASRPMKRFYPSQEHPDWSVWSPDYIWTEIAAMCREVVGQIDSPKEISAVAVTGMGMDGLPMSEDGSALYPMISWYDPRTQPQLDWWFKNVGQEKTYTIGGNPAWAINSALRILWMKENEPEIYRKTFKWILIQDYVNYKLCGAMSIDFSMASCTMLFDQRKRVWSEELCQLAGIPISMLPEIHPSSTFLGELTEKTVQETGLAPGTQVFQGGHDHLCSSLPVGAYQPGSVLDITGTWEAVNMIAVHPSLDPALGRSGMTVQSHVAPNRYTVWGGGPAGEMLEWYRAQLTCSPFENGPSSKASNDSKVSTPSENSDNNRSDNNNLDGQNLEEKNAGKSLPSWDDLFSAAEQTAPGSSGILFLPHLSGSNCPNIDPLARGTFVGLSSRTTQAEMTRAVMEGLGYQFLDVLNMMEQGTGESVKEVVAVGGATRNAFWMQNKADMTGRKVHVPEVDEATVLGVAILAGIGKGIYKDVDDAYEQTKKPSRTFSPNEKNTALYQQIFPIYQELFKAVSPIHHQLSTVFSE